MKKLLLLFVTLFALTITSCEDPELNENEPTVELIDPDKDCPPNDRNCNGVPDDEE